MVVKCLKNRGLDLRSNEYENILDPRTIGRFGATGYTEYNALTIGKEYLVMGIVIFRTYQGFLTDDMGFVSVSPTPLFQVIDYTISQKWFFRSLANGDKNYPFIQATFGYSEFCLDLDMYEKLIVKKDKTAYDIYFQRKLEFENE